MGPDLETAPIAAGREVQSRRSHTPQQGSEEPNAPGAPVMQQKRGKQERIHIVVQDHGGPRQGMRIGASHRQVALGGRQVTDAQSAGGRDRG